MERKLICVVIINIPWEKPMSLSKNYFSKENISLRLNFKMPKWIRFFKDVVCLDVSKINFSVSKFNVW
jgi:hypothetical protein